MGVTARELITKWGFDIDESPLRKMEKSITGMKKLVDVVLYGEITKKITEFVVSTAELGAEAYRTSQMVGVQAQALQRYQHAAMVVGTSNESLTTGLKFLSRHLYDASKGSAQALLNLHKVGIGMKEIKTNSPEVALNKIADRFQKMPDGMQKTALAVELFGRGGTQMIPMLNKGSAGLKEMGDEAERMGLVMSQSAIKQSWNFMILLDKLKSTLRGLRTSIGVELIPIITKYIMKIMDWLTVNRNLIKQNIREFFKELIRIGEDLYDSFVFVVGVLKDISKAMGGTTQSTKVLMHALEAFLLSKAIIAIVTTIGAIPTAIIAAVASVYLVIDDLVAYFQGRKSLFGHLMEELKKGLKTGVFNLGLFGMTGFGEVLQGVVKIAHTLYGIFENMFTTIKNMTSPLERVVRNGLRLMGNTVTSASGAMGSFMPPAPSFTPSPLAAAANSAFNSVAYSPNITLNLNGSGLGDNPHAIKNLVQDALDDHWRNAMRDFRKVVGY